MRINSPIALYSQRQLGANNRAAQKSLERLSSGFRINRAGDDAAGLAISEKMRGQIRGLNQARRNVQNGISMVQTVQGALNETASILQRMRELAVRASNDTMVGSDRIGVQKEINQLTSEINRIAYTTEFNTRKLLHTNSTTITSGNITGAANTTGGMDEAAAIGAEVSFTHGHNTITINAGSANGADGNNISVTLKNSTGPFTFLNAVWNGSTLEITFSSPLVDRLLLPNTVENIQNAIHSATSGSPAGLVISAFTVTGGGPNLRKLSGLTDQMSGGQDSSPAVSSSDTFTVTSLPAEGDKININGTTIAFWDSSAGTYAEAAAAAAALGVTPSTLIDTYNGSRAADKTTAEVAADIAGLSIPGVTIASSGDNVTVTSNASGTAGDGTIVSYTGASITLYENTSVSLLIGANTGQIMTLVFNNMRTEALGIAGTEGTGDTETAFDMSTSENATAAITRIQSAIDKVSAERSRMISYKSRLEHTINFLGNYSENLSAAESRIRDVDMAREVVRFTKIRMLQNFTQSVLAQANLQPQGVLKLLGNGSQTAGGFTGVTEGNKRSTGTGHLTNFMSFKILAMRAEGNGKW